MQMLNERAHDLAEFCTELAQKGKDFPTIWATLLESHTLVDSIIPASKLEGTRPTLEIQLITGGRLVFDSESKKFSVK